jgi:predicted dehydrogenase
MLLGGEHVIGYDPDPAAVARNADSHGAVTTTDADAVFADPDVVGVAIATPPRTHYDYSRRALEAGKHVLVEKPPTMTLEEFDVVAALSRKMRRVYMADFTYIFSATVRRLRQVLRDGADGGVTFVQSLRYGDNLRRETIQRLRVAMLKNRMNVLEDLIYHDLGILAYLFDEPFTPEVVGMANNLFEGLPDVAQVMGHIGSARVHIGMSWSLPERRRDVTVFRRKAIVKWNDLAQREKLTIYHLERGREESVPVADSHVEPLQEVARHFIDCIRDGREPETGPEFIRRTVVAFQQARSLADQGNSA